MVELALGGGAATDSCKEFQSRLLGPFHSLVHLGFYFWSWFWMEMREVTENISQIMLFPLLKTDVFGSQMAFWSSKVF